MNSADRWKRRFALAREPMATFAAWRGKRRREFRIFLSHSEQDRDLCEELKSSAAEVGVEVYLAEHDHRPGGDLAGRVEAAIDISNAVVVLVSSNSVNAPYVNQEIGYARKGRKLIIPLVQPGVQPTKLAMLQGLEYIPFDFSDPTAGHVRFNTALRRLIEQQVVRKRQRELGVMMALTGIGLLLSAVADELDDKAASRSPDA